jgi:transcriptional regulator with XRE-family HTH domain
VTPIARTILFRHFAFVKSIPPNVRFRRARERAGLSEADVASRCGISSSSIWDIEATEDELTSCYSPKQLQQLCKTLGVRCVELFGDEINEPPISPVDLVTLINLECRSRGITLEVLEDAVGWRLGECIEPPERVLEHMTLDGLQWLCRELRIDWRRVLAGL